MSKRNSQAAKTAARERLRVERERQAKRDKVKRQGMVAGSLVAVLAVAGGIGYFVVQNNKPGYWEAAKNDKLVKPANTTGTNGTTVVFGKADAKKTLELYEDSRCPVCAQFEQTVGSTVDKAIADGTYKVQYIGATFIDNSDQGEGSKNALSALGAALNVSPEAFLEYKTALYSTKWHPDETDDKFKSDDYLIKVANTVDALKNNKAFQKAVTGGTYDKWALVMSQKFDKSGVTGTPTLKMDGKKLTGSDGQNAPMSVAEYTTAIDKALKA
ncbi:disulfide bond formation protein DsbA [Streptomyces avermitilis]|uniref:DSBA oxidoreductase n=1 Tax=Streptomyces avermitilis TaxID=33903 RepID=A0A4D4MQG7_STRAX|nr:thioredoxin domain-containing protein [Streptomyces avermitilis]KUN54311.1 disulfide bond formation protein DsbA [Streptomyces avermitilis]OOV28211.1 disulfide bond formation protein DsbA [Streptomyces avermitilis]BBJ54356.1 DSBA oxidoreductase [Streptomyces avermitilis]GDY66367.1 DSBA oxidoreductase [Streptomyces avermitilis]GDY73407.1 DSBA oxidoreductase [Streptomyces avermitilis]